MKSDGPYLYGALRMVWLRTAASLRLRHWHGSGVHSPFAYMFARKVFLERRRAPRRGPVYDVLKEAGAGEGVSAMIQAAYSYLGCGEFRLDGMPFRTSAGDNKRGMNIVFRTEDTQHRQTNGIEEYSIECFISPLRNSSRYEACRKAVSMHGGMSIDCRQAVFIFHCKGLNREHIKL